MPMVVLAATLVEEAGDADVVASLADEAVGYEDFAAALVSVATILLVWKVDGEN